MLCLNSSRQKYNHKLYHLSKFKAKIEKTLHLFNFLSKFASLNNLQKTAYILSPAATLTVSSTVLNATTDTAVTYFNAVTAAITSITRNITDCFWFSPGLLGFVVISC